MKTALLNLAKRLPSLVSHIISTVHDEIIVEARQRVRLTAYHFIVKQEMVAAMEKLYPAVPIAVDVRVCASWANNNN